MTEKEVRFTIQIFANAEELAGEDAALLAEATAAIPHAYAPYSNFRVGAAVRLANGKIVTGTNQENAAYPVCLCAEGTALSAASSLYPSIAIQKIAVTVKSGQQVVNHPVAPCGVCRQRLLEYENRFNQPIEIIMAGESGEIHKVKTVKDLLPLHFSSSDL